MKFLSISPTFLIEAKLYCRPFKDHITTMSLNIYLFSSYGKENSFGTTSFKRGIISFLKGNNECIWISILTSRFNEYSSLFFKFTSFSKASS